MELRQYLKIVKIYWLLIVVLALIGASFGYFYTRYLPTGFRATQTFFLSPATVEATAAAGNSNVEAYNAQEKARNFTDTAVAIIASSDFQRQLLSTGESLTVKKNAPQVLTLSTFAATPQQANNLMTRAREFFNNRFGSSGAILSEIGPGLEGSVTATPAVFTITGAILGVGFAIFAISLKTYFKI